jgi:hypothetical protein
MRHPRGRAATAALLMVRANVINQRLLECLDYLTAGIETDPGCAYSSEFEKLSAGHINWG